MSEKNKAKERILNDPDYIWSPKYEFSLKKFMFRHDDGVDISHAAKVLLMTPEEVQEIYDSALSNLKKQMKGNL